MLAHCSSIMSTTSSVLGYSEDPRLHIPSCTISLDQLSNMIQYILLHLDHRMKLIILGAGDNPNSSLPPPFPIMRDGSEPTNGKAICNIVDRPDGRRVLIRVWNKELRHLADRSDERYRCLIERGAGTANQTGKDCADDLVLVGQANVVRLDTSATCIEP